MLVGLPFDIEEVLTKGTIELSTLSAQKMGFLAKWNELSMTQIGARISR
ncbi:MAG: hypothetical protein CM15mP58_07010 [Burkholderiaceae bacterium]|nr:MAG: hypothetical protein CM15mP58_07010 [Burkholderiaceae bacterium]